jgi:TonB family protein
MNKLLFKILLITSLLILPSGVVPAQTEGTDDRPGVIKAVAPKYPPIARASRTSGKVVVKVTLNPAGEVTAAKMISGHPLLAQISLETARRWLFSATDKKEAERFVELEFVYTPGTKKEDAGVFFMPPYQIEIIDFPPQLDY